MHLIVLAVGYAASWGRCQLPAASCQLPATSCQLPAASCQLGLLFAQVAWLRVYDLRQSTHLKLISFSPAGRVIALGNSGLSAPDYICPAIIGEKLEATDAR